MNDMSTKKKRKTKTARKESTANEILACLNKQWASNNDLIIIGGIGLNKAIEDRKNIEKIFKEKHGDDCRLPKAKVPMEEVIDYYKININYLRKISNSQTK